MSAWVILVIAGLLEICWAISLKYTHNFTRLIPSIFTIVALIASIWLLAKAAQSLPIGTAYAVWVGIGAVGSGVLGTLLFKEHVSFVQMGFMILLIISIIGLKVTANH